MSQTTEILSLIATAYTHISAQPGFAFIVFRDDQLLLIKPDGVLRRLDSVSIADIPGLQAALDASVFTDTIYDNGTESIVDWNNGNVQKIAAGENIALSFVNPSTVRPYELFITATAGDVVILLPETTAGVQNHFDYNTQSCQIPNGKTAVISLRWLGSYYHVSWGADGGPVS